MKMVGCDLHARQQSIAMVDTETGELTEKATHARGEMRYEIFTSRWKAQGWSASKPPARCSGSWSGWKS